MKVTIQELLDGCERDLRAQLDYWEDAHGMSEKFHHGVQHGLYVAMGTFSQVRINLAHLADRPESDSAQEGAESESA